MQARDSQFVVEHQLSVDVPSSREYDSPEAALLDESLCQAIEAAEALESEFLVEVLLAELGRHYSERQANPCGQ